MGRLLGLLIWFFYVRVADRRRGRKFVRLDGQDEIWILTIRTCFLAFYGQSHILYHLFLPYFWLRGWEIHFLHVEFLSITDDCPFFVTLPFFDFFRSDFFLVHCQILVRKILFRCKVFVRNYYDIFHVLLNFLSSCRCNITVVLSGNEKYL